MPKTSAEKTTAENLEARFEEGDDVLDYFDSQTARVVLPEQLAAVQAASVARLQRALRIAEQIQRLEKELISVLESEMSAAVSVPAAPSVAELP